MKPRKLHIVDSHSHLHRQEFSEDRGEVIMRARDKGVEKMLLVGLNPEDSQKALGVAREFKGIFVAAGIHPLEAMSHGPADVLSMANLAMDTQVIAIGETGIDLYRAPKSIEKQKELFLAHISLACTLKLPLIIHDRDAHESVINILDKEDGWALGGVIHCFSGDLEMALYVIKRGFFISISGSITYKNASAMKKVINGIPSKALLVETDAPFLAPEPYRGKKNEPAFLIETLKTLADIKGVSVEEMAVITTQNFERLFFKRKARTHLSGGVDTA